MNESFVDLIGRDVADWHVEFIMAGKQGSSEVPDYQRVQLGRSAATDLRILIQERLDYYKQLSEDGLLAMKQFTASSKLDRHEVEHLALRRFPQLQRQINSLGNLASLPQFSGEDTFISILRFFVLALTDPRTKKCWYFFRIYSPKKELSRSNHFAFLFSKSQFDKLTESLYVFDRYIDCISDGNVIFILNKDGFQKLFQFYQVMTNSAKSTLQIIKDKGIIYNFSEFEAACLSHLHKTAKMRNLGAQPYLNNLTPELLHSHVLNCNLKIEVKQTSEGPKLIFDTRDKWAILKLLDDDYLVSKLTQIQYETNSKRPAEGAGTQ